MENKCRFKYVGGAQCEERTRSIDHEEALQVDTEDPNGSSPFYQAWHKHTGHEGLCFYHKQMMEGRIDPVYNSLIPPETRVVIARNKAIVEQEFVDKKVELNGWKRRNIR